MADTPDDVFHMGPSTLKCGTTCLVRLHAAIEIAAALTCMLYMQDQQTEAAHRYTPKADGSNVQGSLRESTGHSAAPRWKTI